MRKLGLTSIFVMSVLATPAFATTNYYNENRTDVSDSRFFVTLGTNIADYTKTKLTKSLYSASDFSFNFGDTVKLGAGVDFDKKLKILFDVQSMHQKERSNGVLDTYKTALLLSLGAQYTFQTEYLFDPYIRGNVAFYYAKINRDINVYSPAVGVGFGLEHYFNDRVFTDIGIDFGFLPESDVDTNLNIDGLAFSQTSVELSLKFGFRF